jgi:hypothetical protein
MKEIVSLGNKEKMEEKSGSDGREVIKIKFSIFDEEMEYLMNWLPKWCQCENVPANQILRNQCVDREEVHYLLEFISFCRM